MEKIKKFLLYCFTDNGILNKKQRSIIHKNLIISPFYGLIEMIGIGLIVILLINILNKDFINRINDKLNFVSSFNLEVTNLNLYIACICLIFVKYVTQYFIVVFTFKNLRNIHYEVTIDHLSLNMNSKSEFLLQKNISNIIRSVINDTNIIFIDFLRPAIEIFKEICVIIFIIIILLFFNGFKVFGILLFFSVILLLITKSATKIGKKVSFERFTYNKKFFKNLSEFFLLIKEIRLKNFEEQFILQRGKEFKLATNAFAKENIIGHKLKFLFEGIFITSILILIGYLFFFSEMDSKTIYSNLFVLVLPSLRLMPSFLRINGYINKINFNYGIIDGVEKNIKLLKQNQLIRDKNNYDFKNEIKINELNFSYEKKIIFKNANIKIMKGKSHAIIGPTGCGKSTLVEILLGFKSIKAGTIKMDGKEISNRDSYGWRKNFGYVPQDTYLIDGTLIENITLDKENLSKTNKENILQILKYLQLDDLANYEEIFEKKVGSYGKKISGGQKQRIGLARTLFNNPEIIILDEPTSALNKEKSSEIIDFIINLNKTLIMITHDEKLLDKFDFVYKIHQNEIKKIN